MPEDGDFAAHLYAKQALVNRQNFVWLSRPCFLQCCQQTDRNDLKYSMKRSFFKK
jgi:hypothetical protein